MDEANDALKGVIDGMAELTRELRVIPEEWDEAWEAASTAHAALEALERRLGGGLWPSVAADLNSMAHLLLDLKPSRVFLPVDAPDEGHYSLRLKS